MPGLAHPYLPLLGTPPPVSDLHAFLYKLISKEHALVIKEFPDWVEL